MKALILDFDQTIADTSMLEHLRKARNWQTIYRSMAQIKLYEGILELIVHAQSKSYNIGVVSSSPKKYCEAALNFIGIEPDTLVGYHCTQRRKPFPDPILTALKNLNAKPEYSFGLGDTSTDIMAYNSAGIKSVACLWGAAPSLRTACNPTFFIERPEELYRHI